MVDLLNVCCEDEFFGRRDFGAFYTLTFVDGSIYSRDIIEIIAMTIMPLFDYVEC